MSDLTDEEQGSINRALEYGMAADVLAEVARIVRAREAQAEARWMKVAVMKDGQAIREAQAHAYAEGVAAGQTWGRSVNAPYPHNPYRADRIEGGSDD